MLVKMHFRLDVIQFPRHVLEVDVLYRWILQSATVSWEGDGGDNERQFLGWWCAAKAGRHGTGEGPGQSLSAPGTVRVVTIRVRVRLLGVGARVTVAC